MTITIRDRVIELRRVPSSQLDSHPMNWRRHPQQQVEALDGILAEVGIAGALLGFPADGKGPDGDFSKLMIFDGHARKSRDPNQTWPIIVTDLTREEADKMLAVTDPIAAMAEADAENLQQLLSGLNSENQSLTAMLKQLGEQHPIPQTEQVIASEGIPESVATITQPGDLWLLGNHRLLCGNSFDPRDIGIALDGRKADVSIVDPPYEGMALG